MVQLRWQEAQPSGMRHLWSGSKDFGKHSSEQQQEEVKAVPRVY